MKYLMILTVGVCLLLTSVPAYSQSDAIKQEVIKADRAREAAWEKGDGEAWAKYIVDECRWTVLSTGEILQDKAQRAANTTKNGPIEQPAKLSDEKFLIGETLVTQTGVYTFASGTMRFARIWQKQDGQWLMVALYVDSRPE